jgi:predicted DsbA family dithiol-disulfide isomerase
MTLELDLFLDPTCPYCYMAFEATTAVARRRGYRLRLRPLPIAGARRGEPAAETAMRAAHRDAEWPAIEALAADRYGLRLARPAAPALAGPAARAAVWAARATPGEDAAVFRALYEAHFRDGLDIGDPAALAKVLAPFGAPADLGAAIAVDEVSRELSGHRRAAEASGVTAVPSAIGGGYLILGAQPEAVLERTLSAIDRAEAAVAGGGP